jgi:hypothetical protein
LDVVVAGGETLPGFQNPTTLGGAALTKWRSYDLVGPLVILRPFAVHMPVLCIAPLV